MPSDACRTAATTLGSAARHGSLAAMLAMAVGSTLGCSGASPRPAAPADPCSESKACKSEGRCTERNGKCTWGSDLDCSQSDQCKSSGLCSLVEGRCMAGSDRECGQSSNCKRKGDCYEWHGRCAPQSDEDCGASSECPSERNCYRGRGADFIEPAACWGPGACCQVNPNRAVVRRPICTRGPISCKRVCKLNGQCANIDGACTAVKDKDCRRSEGCREWGECSLGPCGYCFAGSDRDCKRSKECRTQKKCKAIDGFCRRSTDDRDK